MICYNCGKSFDSTTDATTSNALCPMCRQNTFTNITATVNEILIIDRIEGDVVICQDTHGYTLHLERSALPDDISDGDLIQKSIGVVYEKLEKTSEDEKKKAQSRLDSLFKRDK